MRFAVWCPNSSTASFFAKDLRKSMENYSKPTFNINGSRVRLNMQIGWIILFAVTAFIFLLPIMVFLGNNLAFDVGYSDIQNVDDDHISSWASDDPRLIQHIRQHYLYPPSPRNKPYELKRPNLKDWSHKRQSTIVADLLSHKTNGFFLECGAYDGETYSNTLMFEKYLNWTGLLIEPDHANIKRLMVKNRKAWVLRGCLHGGDKPKKMSFVGAMEIGTLSQYTTPIRSLLTRLWRPTKVTQVWCFPLYSVLLAVNRTRNVDYFALDVEGAEMDILRGTPLNDKIDVKVMQVEYMVFQGLYWDKDLSTRRKNELRQFMRETLPAYKEAKVVFLDLIFIKQ